ncbi:unnamed protein product, partial [Ectocarpus fasciculatus]
QVAALSELRRFKDSPYDDTLARGEYFDVLYRGLCGAHIAAAVVARGGIVADSKDGWLRKASALVRVVCLACPNVKPGVELLGKALQLAERDKMADHVEHVAKSSRSPRDVSFLAEQTALRLVFDEGRAETDEKSLDAMKLLEKPTDEWLPVWLLEEAAVEGDQGDGGVVVAGIRARGAPGTETARRAAIADGCTMLKPAAAAATRGRGREEGGRAGSAAPAGRAATSSSVERSKGPRKLRVGGRGTPSISPERQRRALLGLRGDDQEKKQANGAAGTEKEGEEGAAGGGELPPNASADASSQPKGRPRSAPTGGQSGDRSVRKSPPQPGRNSYRGVPKSRAAVAGAAVGGGGGGGGGVGVAAAQRSWGRSGSWYEPRRRQQPAAAAAAVAALAGQEEEDDDDDDDDEEDEAAIGGVTGGGDGRCSGEVVVPPPPPPQQQQQRVSPSVAESVALGGPGASGHRRRGSREVKDSSRDNDNDNSGANGLPEENMFFMRKQNSKGRAGAGGRARGGQQQDPGGAAADDSAGARSRSSSRSRASGGLSKDNVAAAAAAAMAEGRPQQHHERSSSRTRLQDRNADQQGPGGAAEAARLREASEERRSYGRSIAAAAKAVANPGYADSACGSVVILDRESRTGLSVLNPYDEVDADRTGSGSGSGRNKAAIFAAAPSAASSGRGDGGRPSATAATAAAAAAAATGRSGSRESSTSSGLRQQERRRPSSPAGHIHTAEQKARRRQEGGSGRGRRRGPAAGPEATPPAAAAAAVAAATVRGRAPSSPTSSKKSGSGFFSAFLSGSKKIALAEAGARDSFGSSDGTDSAFGGSGSVGSSYGGGGGTRPTHRRRGSRGSHGSSSSLGLSAISRDQYGVSTTAPEVTEETLVPLSKSSSVSDLIASNEKKIAGNNMAGKRGGGSSHKRGFSVGSVS